MRYYFTRVQLFSFVAVLMCLPFIFGETRLYEDGSGSREYNLGLVKVEVQIPGCDNFKLRPICKQESFN